MKTEDLLTKVRERIALGSGTAFEKELADALETSEAGAAAMRESIRTVVAHVLKIRDIPRSVATKVEAALSSTAGAEMLEAHRAEVQRLVEKVNRYREEREHYKERLTAVRAETEMEEWRQRTRIEEDHVRMHLELRRAAETEMEEWRQRTRIEEGHVRMHLELRRAAEAERDRLRTLCGEAAETLTRVSVYIANAGGVADLAARLKEASDD